MTHDEKNDEKLLKQTSPLIKYARIFMLLWGIVFVVPAVWFLLTYANNVKEFAVVSAVSVADGFLTEQYQSFSEKLLNKIDVEKYTSKITVPEIKFDEIQKANQKAQKASTALSKLGIKQVDKITDTTVLLQKKIDEINQKTRETTDKIKKSLNREVRQNIEKEITGLAGGQIQKQLNLTDGAYRILIGKTYGLSTEKMRENTHVVYEQLRKNKTEFFENVIDFTERSAGWIKWLSVLFVTIVLFIPPFVFFKLAKKLSGTFTQCPYCKKVFVSKQNATNLLKLIKFW